MGLCFWRGNYSREPAVTDMGKCENDSTESQSSPRTCVGLQARVTLNDSPLEQDTPAASLFASVRNIG